MVKGLGLGDLCSNPREKRSLQYQRKTISLGIVVFTYVRQRKKAGDRRFFVTYVHLHGHNYS